jgi:hypothetical protein
VEKIREFGRYLESKSKALVSIILRQTAAYLFNIVLLPLLMVVTLYLGAKYTLSFVPARPAPPALDFGSAFSDLTDAVKRLEERLEKTDAGTRGHGEN